MRKVLIAATPGILTEALIDMLCVSFEVHTCSRGDALPDFLESLHPDALIVDLALPGSSCLGILNCSVYLPPAVLTLTAFLSQDVVRGLERAGVGYAVRLPCSAETVVARVEEMLTERVK